MGAAAPGHAGTGVLLGVVVGATCVGVAAIFVSSWIYASPMTQREDADQLASLAGAVRVLSGVAFMTAPGSLGRLLVGVDADALPGPRVFVRAEGSGFVGGPGEEPRRFVLECLAAAG